MKWDGLPLVIFGISGISKEVKTIIEEINLKNYEKMYDFLGFVAEQEKDVGRYIGKSPIVCSDESFEEYVSHFPVIGIVIPIGTPQIKKRIYECICNNSNLIFPNIISPSAKIMDYTSIQMGIGNIICSGCVLTTEICMGNFNLINLNSTIGHNVQLGNYNVVNPMVSVSGGVVVKDEVLLGAGSAVKQYLEVKENSIIGLGAIITKDVTENKVMICHAAHEMEGLE